MQKVTFITGNQRKADYLANYLGFPVDHVKVDVEELQSLDLKEIVKHKLRQAYMHVQGPVLVEDTSLEFTELGKLPGPFIKWFIQEIGLEKLCGVLDDKDRTAVARCMYGYFDGTEEKYFEGSMAGTISNKPMGDNGYGYDAIFIPEGYTITRAQMGEEDDKKTYLQIKPLAQVKEFLLAKN
jgi:non-canonical purine NTP pyrophosphatase (RdgB/HAM1 family)